MAADSSQPPPPSSDFPAEKTKAKTNREAQNETRKDVTYKTKCIKFRGRKRRIILQNENGPCPLIAICNVLLLRKQMNLYPDGFQVSQERLLSLVADILFESNTDVDSYDEEFIKKLSDAIDLLPRFADGINVNIKFRSIDDFEFTPELAIFRSLRIPLYHGWIVDPQDFETAAAIGCKSYNDLMTGLVTLETQTVKARSCQSSAALKVPFSKTSSFAADSTPTSAEHGRLRRGDVEEEMVLLRVLRLSEREKLGFDSRRDSSSGGESVSGFSYQMSEDDSLLDSGCSSTPGSSNVCHQSKCDDQCSSKESEDERDCDVGKKIDVGEVVCSATSITKSSGDLDHDQLSATEFGDDTVCDVETDKSSKTTAVHVTSSDTISAEKTNLESTKVDSSSEIPLESEAVTSVNPDFSGSSHDNGEPQNENEECVSLGTPVYEGESLVGKGSSEGRDTNGLTPEEGELINNFLSNSLSQLTVTGISYLQEELIEDELCVFFRNNHFYTMLKHENAIYNLVTDEGYLNERHLVWEKLNQVNGDSFFVTGDFKVFKCESGKWDQQNAVSNTADYIFGINSSAKEGMEIDPDLKMAMELQQQELSGGIDFEVPIRRSYMSFSIPESENSPKMANVQSCIYIFLMSPSV